MRTVGDCGSLGGCGSVGAVAQFPASLKGRNLAGAYDNG
jgi:hypothetical protein